MKWYYLYISAPILVLVALIIWMVDDAYSTQNILKQPRYLIVQYASDGIPFNCWRVGGELEQYHSSTSIRFKTMLGYKVSIGGTFNVIRVDDRRNGKDRDEDYDFNAKAAGKELGIDINKCLDGKYHIE